MSYKNKKAKNWTPREYAQWKKDLGDRLRKSIDLEYGERRQFKFAKDVGISQGSLSEIINGISTPSALTLMKIMERSEIDVVRLLRG